MNEMQEMANNWTLIGLILALVLLFASGVAIWTRVVANAKIQGQTIWHVAVGVAGVVAIASIKLGSDALIFLMTCFCVAAMPMAIEYFQRVHAEEKAAREELIRNVNASTDRQE